MEDILLIMVGSISAVAIALSILLVVQILKNNNDKKS